MTPNFCLGLYDPSEIRGRNENAAKALAAPEYQKAYEALLTIALERDVIDKDLLSIQEDLSPLQKEALEFCWPWIGTKKEVL